MSAADTHFMDAMDANHRAGISVANQYLATPEKQRTTALSDMAKEVIKSHTAEIAKMAMLRPGAAATTPPADVRKWFV